MFLRKHVSKNLLLLLLLALAAPTLALATPQYRMTLLPQDFNAAKLNRAGQVVGTARGGAAVWSPASTTYLASLLPGSEGLAINNGGAVAGLLGPNAFLYDSVVTTFGSDVGDTWVTDVNDAGQVTGFIGEVFGTVRAFTYGAGVFTELGSFGGAISVGNAINATGQVAGFASRPGDGSDWPDPERYASVYRDGVQHDLGSLGGRISEANDINDAGVVAGWSRLGDGIDERPFLFAPDEERMIDLGTLGGVVARANALNNAGYVVGLSDIGGADGFDYRAFVYGAGAMTELTTLVAGRGDWEFVNALDINDAGQILAEACRNDLEDCRAVRLDLIAAVPEPGTWAMLGAGLLMLLWRLRARSCRIARKQWKGLLTASLLAPLWATAAPLLQDTADKPARFRVTFVPDGFTAYAINSRGHVVGDNGSAAVWDGASVRDFAAVAPGSIGRGINRQGTLAGGYADSAHVFSPAGLRNLERGTLFYSSYALGINDSGVVIGNAFWGAGERVRGFVVTRGITRPIPSLGGDFSFALAINRHGQVTGNAAVVSDPVDAAYRAFIFRDATLLDLGTLGGRDSAGNDINDAGQVAGYSDTAEVDEFGEPFQAPFLYANGVMRNLGSLGGNYGVANGLNNAGAVVGWSFLDVASLEQRAFLYEDGVMRDLNGLSNLPAGWVLSTALDINDARQILALACNDEGCRHVRLDPPVQ